jgi:hypothetical protein
MLKQKLNSQGYVVGWEEIPETETTAAAAGTLHIAPAPKASDKANKNKKA